MKTSVIIPARNEQFLQRTVDDIFTKAVGDFEVLVVLDGWWPDPILKDRPNLILIHRGASKGMRNGINSAAAIAKGEYLLKCDAHCMFDEGFDAKLAADCESDWVVVPKRKRLDAENWCIEKSGRPDIDYMYLSYPADIHDPKTPGFHGKLWEEKNRDESLKKDLLVDLMTAQGSCWFMRRDYFYELELLDEEKYGTFANEFQEIGLKAWLSGGKVMRNKATWYAHLHKGSKFGRGYPLSKRTIARANSQTKKWATNEAWDKKKVRRDFKWLIGKFSPVPGWENHDWNEWGTWDTVEEKPVRLYQNIGADFLCENPKRKDSKFWNEGKWRNFIAPLLLEDCKDQTFVEMGCNAGLFLNLAGERGFRNVVGVEKSRSTCEEALRYRDLLGHDYKIFHRTAGVDFDLDEIPVADVTLLSTVHYYFDIDWWLKYLDRLRNKTRYCLVVSRPLRRKQHWRPGGELPEVRSYFGDWEETGTVTDVPVGGDPHPRAGMFSVAFKSGLQRRKLDDLYAKNEKHGTWKQGYIEMDAAKIKLAEEISRKDEIKMEETDYYKQWVERKKGEWPDEKIHEFVGAKIDLMLDVKHNGLREPLIIKSSGQICDGGHRLAILRALGHESAIARVVV